MIALRVVARRADLRLLLLRLLGLLLLGLHFRGLLLQGLQLPHGAHTQVKRRMWAVLLHYMHMRMSPACAQLRGCAVSLCADMHSAVGSLP